MNKKKNDYYQNGFHVDGGGVGGKIFGGKIFGESNGRLGSNGNGLGENVDAERGETESDTRLAGVWLDGRCSCLLIE